MGGSGGTGYFSGRTNADELLRRVREQEAKTVSADFEISINDLIATRLGQINDRDSEAFNQILNRIKSDLQNDLEDTVDLRFGGSVSKHTYVDGLSDVDALVLLKETGGASPEELKIRFAQVLEGRFGRENVTVGSLAVTVQLEDKIIQLLPAVKTEGAYKIADASGKQWSEINPSRFAEKLTQTNKEMAGKLVPTIKLAKSIISQFPEPRQTTGYHTEALAIAVFRDYQGPKTTKSMLRYFFEVAPTRIREPIRDSTGQSVHVDEYLGPANSVQRRIIADAFDRMARRLRNADLSQSRETWQELLDAE